MLPCAQCQTLNPEVETACLACGAALVTASTQLRGGDGRCSAGHPVDPSWRTCPYCELSTGGERIARGESPEEHDGVRATRLETVAPKNPFGTPAADLATRPLKAPTDATVLSPLPTFGDSIGPGAPRRLSAVLAAAEVGSEGTVFPVRSGRNTLGSGHDNDIVLDTDSEISREHAVILHRNGEFHLADRLSTNGSWLNDHEVPANGSLPLTDRDRIRLGTTDLLFLRLDGPPR